jgi:hypothetical protein
MVDRRHRVLRGTRLTGDRWERMANKETDMAEPINPKLEEHPGSNTEKNPDDWVSGDEPMTGAQASYLTTLSEEAGQAPPPADLSKAEASKRIDALKGQLGR